MPTEWLDLLIWHGFNIAAGIAAGIAVGITLPTALLRAYYWPFALVFVWPKLKPTTITPPSA